MPDLPATKILTVSEITRRIKGLLERDFPSVWLEGEVSNLRSPGSGHVYFTLKDAGAQIAAVLFRSATLRYASSRWTMALYDLAAIAGSCLVIFFGIGLFLASLGPARPF